jgi:hypothetical protein
MNDETVTETLNIYCPEEARTAHLLVEWRRGASGRELIGIHCDNPRLAMLEPWDCRWSCWEKVEEEPPTRPPGDGVTE